MANNFTNVNLNTFFDKLDGGATWSAGVAFKRAAALPLERYEVHKSYADALVYAQENAVAYPGQVIAVVETEGTTEKIKIYYIDESKNLQEVGSATLGDEVSIVLDPVTKKLSIKGFENAGYIATKDTTVATNKDYYTYADGKYTKVTAPTGNPKETGYFERVAVKLIKDSDGNLAWVTDDAVQIQGDIAALQTTVNEHGARLDAVEKEVDDLSDSVDERLASLGTVFNYVGALTVTEFSATTGSDSIIDADKKIPDGSRAYRAGDVVFVKYLEDDNTTVNYVQEYVATSTDGGLVWEAFGDPTGVTELEAIVARLDATSTSHTNDLIILNGTESTTGSVKNTAKGYADIAENNAKVYAEQLISPVSNQVQTNKNDIDSLETTVSGHTTSINNINTAIGTDDTANSIKGRIKTIEGTMATKTDLEQVATDLETLEGNVYTKSDADGKFALKTDLEGVRTTANTAKTKAEANEGAISTINTAIGTDTTAGSIKGRIKTLENTTGTHTSQISTLQGEVSGLKAADGPIVKAQTTADAAKTAAQNADAKAVAAQNAADAAQGTANTAVADAAKAQEAADNAQDAADAAQGTADTALANAATADGKAVAAGTAASNAQTTANEAKAKAEANEAKFADYYTKGETDDKVAAVVGVAGDASSKDTVKGAKKYTDEKIAGVNTSITTLRDEIKNLTNVMNFIGKSTTDPSTGTVTVGGKVITPDIGDVVVYEEFEYVYTGTTDGWEIFGNVTADESRFDSIEQDIVDLDERLDTAESEIDALQSLTSGHTTSINNVTGRVSTIESDLNTATTGIKARLTAVEGVAAAAATKTELTNEITRATNRENAIEKYAQDGFAAQATTNTNLTNLINAITNVDDGLLAWGEF